jgi:hypothetical protein
MTLLPGNRIYLYSLFLLALLYSCASVDNQEILLEYIENHNAHEVDKTMDLFHDDAKLYLPGQPPIAEIRTVEAWDAAIGGESTYSNWRVNGDTIVIGTIIESNKWFKRAGIEKVEYRPGTKFIFKDGKIYEIWLTEMTLESQSEVAQMFGSFIEWAKENRPAKVRYLMPQGKFDLREEKARDWFLLMDEWQNLKN